MDIFNAALALRAEIMFSIYFCLTVLVSSSFSMTKQPNFVIFLADDLGYGDIGAFGNTSLPTPNIDNLANGGVKLTHHLAAASMCTPSRAALLTGRYPIRYGMASDSINRVFFFVASTGGLPESEITFPKLLQRSNYSTALIGKWHLGSSRSCHHPLNHGFDYFYGLPLTNMKDFGDDNFSIVLSKFPYFYHWLSTMACIGFTSAFLIYNYKQSVKIAVLIILSSLFIPGLLLFIQRNITLLNSILMRNATVIEQPINFQSLNRRLVNEGKNFIIKMNKEHKPFLLFVSFVKVHTAHFPSKQFAGKSKYGKFGDSVMELDWAVGQLANTLVDLRIDTNTFIYFSSDNGGHLEEVDKDGHHEGGYNGVFPGGKGQGAVEGGIRVPSIIQWKGRFNAKQEISVPTSQMDLFATVLEIANISKPNERIIDGISLLPLIRTENRVKQLSRKFLFHYCGSYLSGVRYFEDFDHIWKVYFSTPNYKKPNEFKCGFVCQCYGSHVIRHNPPLLYNLVADPSEMNPLSVTQLGHLKYNEILSKIKEAIVEHKKSIDSNVESQFTIYKTFWWPPLQPCCNFPRCYCREEEIVETISDSKQLLSL